MTRGRPKGVGNIGTPLNPHRRLVAALIANAVTMAQLKAPPRDKRPKEDTPEVARAWLASERSTRWLCLLGYDPQAFREALRRRGVLP